MTRKEELGSFAILAIFVAGAVAFASVVGIQGKRHHKPTVQVTQAEMVTSEVTGAVTQPTPPAARPKPVAHARVAAPVVATPLLKPHPKRHKHHHKQVQAETPPFPLHGWWW